MIPTQIPISTPFGSIIWEAEIIKRDLGNSQNKAKAFVMADDEVFGKDAGELIYEDVVIIV